MRHAAAHRTEYYGCTVKQWHPSNGSATILAGAESSCNLWDGDTSSARFGALRGIAMMGNGVRNMSCASLQVSHVPSCISVVPFARGFCAYSVKRLVMYGLLPSQVEVQVQMTPLSWSC